MVGKLQRWWHISPILWYHRHLLSYLHSYSFTFSWCIEHRYVGFLFTVWLRFDRFQGTYDPLPLQVPDTQGLAMWAVSFNISIELVEIAPFFFFLMSEPRHGGPETNRPIVQISHQFYVNIIFSVVQCADVCNSSFSKQCVITANVWLASGLICSMHQHSMIKSF